jgi:hypothetical protein
MNYKDFQKLKEDKTVNLLGVNPADKHDVGCTIETVVTSTAGDVYNPFTFKDKDGKELTLVYLKTEVSDRVMFPLASAQFKPKQAVTITVELSNSGKKRFKLKS